MIKGVTGGMDGKFGKLKISEDSNLKTLRELAQLPSNRHCFDCGQRGPTYVNITIGSFVCMTCSGLLRGLTPPQRVKSISMASFTNEEMDLLKTRGNEYCRRVWLATCSAKDSNLGPENDPERVNHLKSFMSAKYEQKRFYIDPSKLPKSDFSDLESLSSSNASTSAQKSPSLSSSSSQNNPSPVMNNLRNNRLVNSVTMPDVKPLSSLLGPTPDFTFFNASSPMGNSKFQTPINYINNLQSSGGGKSGNLQISPWEMAENGNGDNSSVSNFADFDDAFKNCDNFFSTPAINSPPSDFNMGKQNGSSNVGTGGTGMRNSNYHQQPIQPNMQGGNNNSVPQPAQILAPNPGGNEDRYAALKDLDSLFKQNPTGEMNGANVIGMSSSASLPALSSTSSGGPSASTGWFSTSPNQNPFSQDSTPTNPTNGWAGMNGGGMNGIHGTSFLNSNSNPSNPFSGGTGGSQSGWGGPTASKVNNGASMFPSHPPSFQMTPQYQNNLFGSPPNQQRSVEKSATFNPFFGSPPPFASNPHNPFL